jgi:hypothetical protein
MTNWYKRATSEMVLYRGQMKSPLSSIFAVGTHYSTNKDVADLYSEVNDTQEVHVTFDKPYIIDMDDFGYDYTKALTVNFSTYIPNVVTKMLLNNNYDALIIKNSSIGRGTQDHKSDEVIILPDSFELSDQLKYMYRRQLNSDI